MLSTKHCSMTIALLSFAASHSSMVSALLYDVYEGQPDQDREGVQISYNVLVGDYQIRTSDDGESELWQKQKISFTRTDLASNEDQNLTDTNTRGINFEFCLDAQMTDCLVWKSDRARTTIEERHGPVKVKSGSEWPNIHQLPLTNAAIWSFSKDHLYNKNNLDFLTYQMHLNESSPSTEEHPGPLVVTFSRKIASNQDEMKQLVGKKFNMYFRLFNYTNANPNRNGTFAPRKQSFLLGSLEDFILSQPEVFGHTVHDLEQDQEDIISTVDSIKTEQDKMKKSLNNLVNAVTTLTTAVEALE